MTAHERISSAGIADRGAAMQSRHGRGRREAIVRAAIRLFIENEGEPTSLEMVASAAGVTRTAVYYYFPSKSDLLQEVLRRLDWDWWLNAIEESHQARTLAGRLRILLHILLTQSSENEESVYFALVKATRGDTDVRRTLRAQLKTVQSGIRDMVAGCDDVREITGKDLDDLVDGVLGLVWSMASGIANTKNRSVVRQMMKAVDLICPDSAAVSSGLLGQETTLARDLGVSPRSVRTNSAPR